MSVAESVGVGVAVAADALSSAAVTVCFSRGSGQRLLFWLPVGGTIHGWDRGNLR